jgi:hypothetical protein
MITSQAEMRMKYSSYVGRWIALGGCILALTAGCGGEWERFFVVQNQVPESGCLIPGTPGDIYRGSGVMDVGLVSSGAQVGYVLFPLLQNDLPARGQAGGTEPNRLVLREFRVRLELAPGAPQPLLDLFASPELAPYLAYSTPWSGSIDPGGGTVSAGVTVVPAEVARQIEATGVLDTLSSVGLTARVWAVGDTLSETIESREFDYPIDACKYCLVSYVAACPYAPANTGNMCNIAQDEPVDCCSDGQSLLCPARAPATGN